jgi:hypothetical protein
MKHTKEGHVLKVGDYIRWQKGCGDWPRTQDNPVQVTEIKSDPARYDNNTFRTESGSMIWYVYGGGYTVVEKT